MAQIRKEKTRRRGQGQEEENKRSKYIQAGGKEERKGGKEREAIARIASFVRVSGLL
jgi:hypothetical protein